MLSASERLYLHWHQRMIFKLKSLTAEQELGLTQWLESGERRTDWPGWEILLGPRPFPPVVAMRKQMAEAGAEVEAERKRGIVA